MYFISRFSLIILSTLSLCATEDTLEDTRAIDAPNLPERTITSMMADDEGPSFSSVLTKSNSKKQNISLEISNGTIQRKVTTINVNTKKVDDEEESTLVDGLTKSIITEESI